ncbi:SseB family protein [Microbacterium sp. P07]|uniref:SseB family protein n=1 Tax=Microbacterium sp. P07 TaxID=3366952 RepID=UPI0037474D6F
MAFFSRRKNPDRPATADVDGDVDPRGAAARPPSTPPDPEASPAASVGISVSAFRGVGAAPESPASNAPPAAPAPNVGGPSRPRTVPAEAPEPTESIPGVHDNVLLRDALAALPDPPTPTSLMNVARQLLQGHLYLRVKGDARTLLAEGRGLPLAVTRRGDKQHVLVYSSGAALQASVTADGDADTSAVAQPVLTVLRHVLDGPYDGMVIDPSSAPARAVLPKPLLQRAVDQLHAPLTLKSLLAGPRADDTAAAVAAALGVAPLWIAARRTDEGGPVGIAESRTAAGDRYLEVYSHPLEVLSLGRGDQPLPVTVDQLGRALAADTGLTGVIVDSGGPWIRLSRAELAAVIPQA